MWVAQANWAASEEPYDCLLMPGKKITLGRQGYAQLAVASKAVSRNALEITVGAHEPKVHAKDPTFRPTLSLKQLAKKAIKIIKADQSTYEVGENGDTELEHGTELEIHQGFIVKILWVEFVVGFPRATMRGHDLEELFDQLPTKLAKLGIKWTDQPSARVTHLLWTKVEKMIAPLILGWPNQTWIVQPKWVVALLEASEPATEDTDKTGARASPLELNWTENCPEPAKFATEVAIPTYPNLSTVVPDTARLTLYRGITVWAWEEAERPDSSLVPLREAWMTSGAKVIDYDPVNSPLDSEDAIRAAVKQIKQDADVRYYHYLSDNSLIIPDLAKTSGLVIVANGAVKQGMEDAGVDQLYEQILSASGQKYTTSLHHYDAFLDASLDPVFVAGRTEGDPPAASSRLPSQIPASVGSTLARARSVVSSAAGEDEEEEDQPVAEPSGHQAEEVPQAPAVPPIKRPLKRRTATRRHDDDYDLWNDTTAVLAAPPTNAVRAASMDVDEVPASHTQTTQSRKHKLVRRTGTNASERADSMEASWAEEEAKSESAQGLAASNKLYEALSKKQSEPQLDLSQSSQGSSLGRRGPPSGQSRPSAAMDVDEEDDDFVKRSLKRIKLEHESQAEEAARNKREAEKQDALWRKEAADEVARRGRVSSEDAQAGPSTARNDRASMPPPPVPVKKGTTAASEAKRKADQKFLEAAATKKKKGAAADPMDLEFNGLKIAKAETLTRKSDSSRDLEGEGELANPRLIVLHVPMYVRTKERRVGGPVEVDGVPNFKKFKKQHIIRSAPIKLTVASNKNDFGLSTDHWRSSSSSKHKDFAPSRSNSFPSAPATQSALPTQATSSIASTSNGVTSSRRKRLLPADSDSDEASPPIQTGKRPRTGTAPAASGKKIASSSAAATKSKTKAIVISSSDEDEDERDAASAAVGSGTMSRTMSDEEDAGSSARRRVPSISARAPVRAPARSARKAMIKDDSSDDSDGRGGGRSTFTTASSAGRSARRR